MIYSVEDRSDGQLEALCKQIGIAIEMVHEYLTGRQSPSGGFCFYRSSYVDHPNIADTACAVRSFAILGQPVPHADQVRAFLSSLERNARPEFLFQLATALHDLRGGPLPDELVQSVSRLHFLPPPAREFQQTGWLQRTRFVVHLKKMLSQADDEVSMIAGYVRAEEVDGGFGTTPNLWDTWLALDVMRVAGIAFPANTAKFVDLLQVGPSGFTLCADTQVSTMNTVFAGAQCCAMLGLPVRYPDDAVRFVLACQVGSGGFAASPGALPDLELTERALKTMEQLCVVLRPG
ncbi:prenyltransferase/squalene oxidase repeat-containing protein [Paraburkholderia sp. J12]|uniref:prenyltransferase/squalene oxidase repeat-containing protein n=1 Tax=Paraburkholderia sp. J12 TaxID=2805432 RepID=UPI002ABE08AE|nr:prenyltransferase/squalene oxidase repeat-containing protein [Paraburkholderia sp. J12]